MTASIISTNRITTSDWEYDLAGNLIRGQNASGVWQKFEYDAAGRLKKVKDDSNNVIETYTYGASHERLMTETSSGRTYYAWGGSNVICEYTETGTSTIPVYSKSYQYAGSRLLSISTNVGGGEATTYQHPDRLGTKLITNSNGTVNARQSTLPFGTEIPAEGTGTPSNQLFTSYDRSSSTGLDYATNRTYSKGQSRFTQVDPIGMGAVGIGNPQSNNLYAYTQNMPTDFIDPSGLNLEAPSSGGYCIRYHYTNLTGTISFWGQPTCYAGSGEGGGSGGGGGNRVTNNCQSFANIVDQLAQEYIDPKNPSSASQTQDFMDALAKWATEFGSATTTGIIGGFGGHPSNTFGDVGFQGRFRGSDTPNQVRHAVGGFIMGFVNSIGDSYAAQGAMALRELRSDLSMDKADVALNSVTMPMGAILSRAGGSKAALRLGDWIRKNLCAPLPQEGHGGR